MEEIIHIHPHKISKNFRVFLLLLPAITFAVVLALVIKLTK